MRENNTPLHEAVIANDIDSVVLYKQEFPEWLGQPNAWGIPPLYLAKLLGHKKIVSVLEPGPETPIQIQWKGSSSIDECSEATFTEKTGVIYTSTPVFSSYDRLSEVIRACPWWLAKTPLGRECRWLGALHEKDFSDGSVANVSIRWVHEEMGYGLFANTPLKKGDFIAEYVGLIHRRYRIHPNTNGYCLHYPSGYLFWKVFMVDAQKHGNYSRFINHSDQPNLYPQVALHTHLLHTLLIAKRPIEAGEELTLDYGRDYWRRRKKKMRKVS